MAVIRGGISTYLSNALLNHALNGVVYTPPTKLWVGLSSKPWTSLNLIAEPAATVTSAAVADLVVDATDNTLVSSASHVFTTADTQVIVTAGSGWTAGTYTIASIVSGKAKLATSPAAVNATGGTYKVVTATGYVRVAMNVGVGLFNVPANGSTWNLSAVTFPAPTADWFPATKPARGIFLADAATAGNLLWGCDRAGGSRTILAGDDPVSIPIGVLTAQLT